MVDPEPDPIDRAYAQAETLLDEQAERSARRTRILAAVAQDTAVPVASDTKPVPRFNARGGWLVAASLLVASYLAVRFLPLNPPGSSHPTVQASSAQRAPKNQTTALLSPPVAAMRPPEPAPSEPKATVPDQAPAAMRAPKASSHEQMAMAAPPSAPPDFAMAPPPPPPAAAPPMAAPPPSAARAFPMAAPPPPAAPAPMMAAPSAAAPPPPVADLARSGDEAGSNPAFDQLRAAAAAGRTSEVQQLLDREIPVDAADADGETALMKSIRADQPATAALLIRHGASLDKKNHAGLSARDLAAQMQDSALDRALGLEP
jgi:hypothetical protein